jgi:hypothetical protein
MSRSQGHCGLGDYRADNLGLWDTNHLLKEAPGSWRDFRVSLYHAGDACCGTNLVCDRIQALLFVNISPGCSGLAMGSVKEYPEF